MSTNNEQRKEAERVFESIVQSNIRAALQNLLFILNTSSCDPVVRLFATVLMRRTVEKGVDNFNEAEIGVLKTELLTSWKTLTEFRLSAKLSHVLAQLSFKQPWAELLPHVMEFALSSPAHALAALNLVEISADYCPEDINTHHQLLCQFLAHFLNNESSVVRMGCAKAAVTCIAVLEEDSVRSAFRAALDPILTVLGNALSNGDETDATLLIENLVTVAQIQPVFFKPALDKMVSSMLSVVDAGALEFSTRSMALEWLVTMTEMAPAMMRRCNHFITHIVKVVLRVMLEVDDDVTSWMQHAYNVEDADENSLAGDEAIERLAASLGGKSMSETVLAAVTQQSQQPAWQCRRAAVAALCRLAEGSSKTFIKYMEQTVPFLLACLQDQAVRVQYEGIQVCLPPPSRPFPSLPQ